MSAPLDLTREVDALCALVDVEPDQVIRIEITPRWITFHVFDLDADGKKYIDPTTRAPANSVVSRPLLFAR